MNDTDNNQQRQTTPSIAKCHELADMVNILFDQSGLQDLLIGKYQLNKYDHFEHLQKYGQYSKLKQYCVLNGLDAQEVSIISSEQNLQHWNTTSGTLYQVEDLNAIRDCIRQKHSQCMAEYLRFLHFVNSTEKIGTSMRNAMAVDSNMILDLLIVEFR